jgi:hypothetical protein
MLHHDGIVHHLLKVFKSVHHQLILDRTNQTIPEVILLLCVICYVYGSVARQLDELVLVLTHRHCSLFQRKELLFLELHQTFGYVLLPELVPELLPGDGVGGVMSCGVSIPLICGGSFQSAQSIKNLLPISTLDDVQHLLHRLDPVISLQRIRWVRK